MNHKIRNLFWIGLLVVCFMVLPVNASAKTTTQTYHLEDVTQSLQTYCLLEPSIQNEKGTITVPFSFFNQRDLFPFLESSHDKSSVYFPYLFSEEIKVIVSFSDNWLLSGTPSEKSLDAPEGMLRTAITRFETRLIYTSEYSISKYLYVQRDREHIKSFFNQPPSSRSPRHFPAAHWAGSPRGSG